MLLLQVLIFLPFSWINFPNLAWKLVEFVAVVEVKLRKINIYLNFLTLFFQYVCFNILLFFSILISINQRNVCSDYIVKLYHSNIAVHSLQLRRIHNFMLVFNIIWWNCKLLDYDADLDIIWSCFFLTLATKEISQRLVCQASWWKKK